jgi:hypothetical protein
MPRGGLMGALFNNPSWGAQARNAEARKRCPPIEDCPVKQSLMASAAEQRKWGVRTKSEVRTATRLARKITQQQRAGRQADAWPYKGRYTPVKPARGRGRS